MHDYWIGDRVWIASLQQEGIFEGEDGDLAIVRIGAQKQRFAFTDISLMPEDEVDHTLEELGIQSKPKPKGYGEFPDSIDLHIEELNPSLIHSEPVLMLAHQRSRLRDFLTAAIAHSKSKVTIIHGKGEGVLRSEVLKVLDEFHEVKRIEEEAHGGAVVVYFK